MRMEGTERIEVLHVESYPRFADLVDEHLACGELSFDVDHVQRGDEALERLRGRTYDCIVSTYEMPEMDGLELFDLVRSTHSDLPFVLYASRDEQVVEAAMDAGVTEYMEKGWGTAQFRVLGRRVRNVVERYRAQRALRRVREASSSDADEAGDGHRDVLGDSGRAGPAAEDGGHDRVQEE